MNSARIIAPWTQGLDVRVSPDIEAPLVVEDTILLPVAFLGWEEEKLVELLKQLTSA